MPPRRLFAALAISVLLFASSSAWAETTYYVEVVLTDAETGNPASGARVLFSDDRGLGMRNPEAIEHGGKPGFYYGSVPLYDNEKQITYRVTVTCQGYEDRIHFLTITRGTPTTPSQSQSQKYYLTNTSIQLYYSHNRLDPAVGLRRKEKQNLRKPSERSSEGFFCQAVLGGLNGEANGTRNPAAQRR